MKKTIKNDIYAHTNQIYAENGTLVMISSFIVWASVILLFSFPFLGFGLSFFAMGFLCLGFRKIVLDLVNNKTPKLENVFDYYKYCISAFCLKVATMVLVFLWSLLFIIPGIIMGLNFVFAPYVLADDPKIGAVKAMQKSKHMIYGNRGNVFVLYLTMALVTVLVALLACFLIIVINMFTTLPLWINILVPFSVTVFAFFVFVFPYFEIVFASMYQEVKKLEEKPKQTRQRKTTTKKIETE